MAIIQRSILADMELASAFGHNWRKNSPTQTNRLVDFRMEKINSEVSLFSAAGNSLNNKIPILYHFYIIWMQVILNSLFQVVNSSVLVEHINLLRSDHSRFWSVNNKKYFTSLPAIVLTDTGSRLGIFSILMNSSTRSLPRRHDHLLPWPV